MRDVEGAAGRARIRDRALKGCDIWNVRNIEISRNGKRIHVPAIQVNEKTVIISGKWLRFATILHEEWLEGPLLNAPDLIIAALKNTKCAADIFAFSQKPYEASAYYPHYYTLDNAAAIPITLSRTGSNEAFLGKLRQDVSRATRLGVTVRQTVLDDALLEGITRIYNETPIRQGAPFLALRQKPGYRKAGELDLPG